MEDDDGYVSVKDRQFLCIAECKEQLDEWISELASEENRTIDDMWLIEDEIGIEWDEQSETLIFMP